MRARLLVVPIPLSSLLGTCRGHGGSPDGDASDLAFDTDGGGADHGPAVELEPAGALTFESGLVRPVALSADGQTLYVANIPGGYLETLAATALTKVASVPVGLEPVAVAVRSPGEVWVVNHLSDRISVVDVASTPPRVTRTHGKQVYAAVFESGSQTIVTSLLLTCDGFDNDTPLLIAGNTVAGAPIGPATKHAGITAPRMGTIAKQDGRSKWIDGRDRSWSGIVKLLLPDTDVFTTDVFTIDTATLVPGATFSHVGMTLFDMAVNPVSGNVYVSNTESRNDLRFEGPSTSTRGRRCRATSRSRASPCCLAAPSPRDISTSTSTTRSCPRPQAPRSTASRRPWTSSRLSMARRRTSSRSARARSGCSTPRRSWPTRSILRRPARSTST